MGLGLAIVRRLAALCGHSVELASTPGRGSRFSITVPRAPALVRERSIAGTRAPSPIAASSRTLPGRRVVVVDDDPAVVAAMQALFASWNAVATGGSDASTAIATLDRRRALVECRRGSHRRRSAPRRRQVRDRRDCALACTLGADTPAIVVSGDTSAAAQAEVRAAGVKLLVKPVVAAALKEAAERAIIPDGCSGSRIR